MVLPYTGRGKKSYPRNFLHTLTVDGNHPTVSVRIVRARRYASTGVWGAYPAIIGRIVTREDNVDFYLSQKLQPRDPVTPRQDDRPPSYLDIDQSSALTSNLSIHQSPSASLRPPASGSHRGASPAASRLLSAESR